VFETATTVVSTSVPPPSSATVNKKINMLADDGEIKVAVG